MKLRLWAAFECDFPAYILISFNHSRSWAHFQRKPANLGNCGLDSPFATRQRFPRVEPVQPLHGDFCFKRKIALRKTPRRGV
jgi:hypothetical protein